MLDNNTNVVSNDWPGLAWPRLIVKTQASLKAHSISHEKLVHKLTELRYYYKTTSLS